MSADTGLFVYGTLGPGRPNEHVLHPLGGTWRPAVITGELIEDGWGATQGYPGIRLNTGAETTVSGWVLRSPALDDHWSMLDEFEGPGYERVLTEATLEDGTNEPVWVYTLRQQT